MEPKIAEIAERIRALREMLGLSCEEMAEATEVSIDDYQASESGAVILLSLSCINALRNSAWT